MSRLSDNERTALTEQVEVIRQEASDAKRSRRRKSKIDKYRDEIQFLRKEGASISEIQVWAKMKGCSVSRTTIFNALKSWEVSMIAAETSLN